MKDGHITWKTLVFEEKISSSDFIISSEFWNRNGSNVLTPAAISNRPENETMNPINFQFFTILFPNDKSIFVYRRLTI